MRYNAGIKTYLLSKNSYKRLTSLVLTGFEYGITFLCFKREIEGGFSTPSKVGLRAEFWIAVVCTYLSEPRKDIVEAFPHTAYVLACHKNIPCIIERRQLHL